MCGARGRIRTSDHLVRSQVLYPAELHALKLFPVEVYTILSKKSLNMVRVEGFEPPTTWFVARYSIQLSYTRNTVITKNPMAEREGFEPSVRINVRFLSRELVSATHPPLRNLNLIHIFGCWPVRLT